MPNSKTPSLFDKGIRFQDGTLQTTAASPGGISNPTPSPLNIGATDVGISRLGPDSLAVGNGTAGDSTGRLTLEDLSVTFTPQAPNWMYEPYGFPTGNPRNNYTGCLGFRFTVLQNVIVNKLGRKYLAGNTQDHAVNLWSDVSGGTLLASGNVLAASASDSNGFKWASVTPVTLVPGVLYSVAADETNGGDTWLDGVSNPVLNGLFGPRCISCYTNPGGVSVYPVNDNGTGAYDAPGIQFVVGPNYTAGLSTNLAGQILVGNGTDQDYSGTIVANGGFSFLAPIPGTSAGGPGPNQPSILYRQYPGKNVAQIVGDFGQAALTPVLVLTNSHAGGSIAPTLILEGSNDTGVYPTRGAQFFHRKDAQATAILDYEACDISFYTGTPVGAALTPRLTITADGRVNILSGVPLQWNADTSISRLASGSLAIGNGAQGNASGKLTMANLKVTGLQVFANNAAAIAGGLSAGDFYRTGADPDPVCVVH